jgi:allophanate hydrolase subunit 1
VDCALFKGASPGVPYQGWLNPALAGPRRLGENPLHPNENQNKQALT